jgi:hypothetical protein
VTGAVCSTNTDYDPYRKLGVDLVSICLQFKVFEYLGFAAFGIRTSRGMVTMLLLNFLAVMLWSFFLLGCAIIRHRAGDGPWMKPTHELPVKQW